MARPAQRRGGERREVRIDLLGTVDLLQRCLTEAVCREVFRQTRSTERVRAWTLHQMAEFWNAVILRAPESLTRALLEAQEGESTGWPTVPSTSKQAFFKHCQDLRPAFFAK